MEVEVHVTFFSLIALPWVISIKRYRYPARISSILGIDGQHALISSSYQGVLILLVCGLVSLLIQYPINLLKGSVISAPYEQRVQRSHCVVHSCETVRSRSSSFRRDGRAKFNIIRLKRDASPEGQASVTVRNLRKSCSPTSLSTVGMLNWTKLAFLGQYAVVCNKPELLHLQLTRDRKALVFE